MHIYGAGIYIYIYIYGYIYNGIHGDTCGYMWIYIYVDICGYMWIHVDTWGYMWIHGDTCGYMQWRREGGGRGGYCPGAWASCGGPGQAGFFLCVDRKSVGDPGGGDPGMITPPPELVGRRTMSKGGGVLVNVQEGGGQFPGAWMTSRGKCPGGGVLVNVFTPPPSGNPVSPPG